MGSSSAARLIDAMSSPCSGCGLVTPSGTEGCQAIFDELTARAHSNPVFGRMHRLVVDTYALQHPPYIESAKSLAAHVCGVCVALEHSNDQNLIYSIHLWLSGPARFEKPPVPEFRGSLRIDSLAATPDFADYRHAVTAWARETWKAYEPLYPVARGWIEELKAWRLGKRR